MRQIVELVNQWDRFESQYPGSSVLDFCRHYLVSSKENDDQERLFEGENPPRPDIVIVKLIDRIARMHNMYIDLAITGLKIKHFEEFSLLSAIKNLNQPTKTEAIRHTIIEISTGLKLLADLKRRGYTSEVNDPHDKRSIRLMITPKGEKVLYSCYERFSKVPEMLFMDMPKEDIELCIQLMKRVDIKFSKLWMDHKKYSFEEAYKTVTGKEISRDSGIKDKRR